MCVQGVRKAGMVPDVAKYVHVRMEVSATLSQGDACVLPATLGRGVSMPALPVAMATTVRKFVAASTTPPVTR